MAADPPNNEALLATLRALQDRTRPFLTQEVEDWLLDKDVSDADMPSDLIELHEKLHASIPKEPWAKRAKQFVKKFRRIYLLEYNGLFLPRVPRYMAQYTWHQWFMNPYRLSPGVYLIVSMMLMLWALGGIYLATNASCDPNFNCAVQKLFDGFQRSFPALVQFTFFWFPPLYVDF
ncbi:hypothetical protein ACN47E_001177 [Coniothyrium glycines]